MHRSAAIGWMAICLVSATAPAFAAEKILENLPVLVKTETGSKDIRLGAEEDKISGDHSRLVFSGLRVGDRVAEDTRKE